MFGSTIRLLTIGLALSAACPAEARPVAECRFSPAIGLAADLLLEEPGAEQRVDQHATTQAAYLKIRYGVLSYQAGRRLIERIRGWNRPPFGIEGLRLTFARPSDRKALLGGTHPVDAGQPGASLERALVLEDGGRQFFPEAKRRLAQPGGRRAFPVNQFQLASALSDLSDTRKVHVARQAEAAGLLDLAEHLLADLDSPNEWLAFVRRAPGAPITLEQWVKRLSGPWTGSSPFFRPMRGVWRELPGELGAAADELERDPMLANTVLRAATFRRLAEHSPHAAQHLGLMAFAAGHAAAVHSSDSRPFQEFFQALLDEVHVRRLDVTGDEDEILILIAERHGGFMDRQGTGAEMRNALAALTETPRARRALLPYLDGRTSVPPARPDMVRPEFDWESWLATAALIRARQPVPQKDNRIAIELLDVLGRHRDALALLRGMPADDDRWERARRMLVTLDRQCAGLLRLQGSYGPVYRFEPR
ncbi:MAG: hypothetical protein J0H01_04290 [Rhizobiales bacterium]|nr:hypothetical protein [Hyphomicrobiales bacterium]